MLFGTRLPKVARSLGQGISSFKKGLNEPVEEEDKQEETPKVATGSPKSEEKASDAQPTEG